MCTIFEPQETANSDFTDFDAKNVQVIFYQVYILCIKVGKTPDGAA